METTTRTARRWFGSHGARLVPVAALAIVLAAACTGRPPVTPPSGGGGGGGGGGNTTTTASPGGGGGGGGTGTGGTQTVTKTIKLTSNFDGRGTTYKGGGDLGGSSTGEGKKAIFEVAAGLTVSNLTIGNPGADGIHCLGTCTLKNITWTKVLDDAATLLSKSAGDTMTIDGGSATGATDKVFQHNGPGTVVIKNFTANGFGKIYRSCGNCSSQFKRSVVLQNVTAVVSSSSKTLVGINTNYGDTATLSGITIKNDPSHKVDICEKFTGNSSGDEPKKLGAGPGGGCNYKTSDVTYK
jgi:hypothetical protein